MFRMNKILRALSYFHAKIIQWVGPMLSLFVLTSRIQRFTRQKQVRAATGTHYKYNT